MNFKKQFYVLHVQQQPYSEQAIEIDDSEWVFEDCKKEPDNVPPKLEIVVKDEPIDQNSVKTSPLITRRKKRQRDTTFPKSCTTRKKSPKFT